jgi:hypothetical protein
MTQDEIIEMAREAGFGIGLDDPIIYAAHERFAKLVAKHEREAWVKVCDEMYYAFQVKRKIENKLDEERT